MSQEERAELLRLLGDCANALARALARQRDPDAGALAAMDAAFAALEEHGLDPG